MNLESFIDEMNPQKILLALFTIVIGIVSFNIAYKTYEEIDYLYNEEIKLNQFGHIELLSEREKIKEEFLYVADAVKGVGYTVEELVEIKKRARKESNRFAILYSSVLVFCTSFCCLTYLSLKK